MVKSFFLKAKQLVMSFFRVVLNNRIITDVAISFLENITAEVVEVGCNNGGG
jgi:hypothetical protein